MGERQDFVKYETLQENETSRATWHQFKELVLKTLPPLDWHTQNGIFAIDEEEFKLVARGTSMESWQSDAKRDTENIFMELQKDPFLQRYGNITLAHVKWAYVVYKSRAVKLSVDPVGEEVFLPPIFIRPNVEGNVVFSRTESSDIIMSFDKDTADSDFSKALHPTEIFFSDPSLTDASALCYHGLWLTRKHRIYLRITLPPNLIDF